MIATHRDIVRRAGDVRSCVGLPNSPALLKPGRINVFSSGILTSAGTGGEPTFCR